MTGALEICKASFMVATDTWDRSIMTPKRFISFSRRFPKGDSPWLSASSSPLSTSQLSALKRDTHMCLGNRAVVSTHPHPSREQGLVWSSGEARDLVIIEGIGFLF